MMPAEWQNAPNTPLSEDILRGTELLFGVALPPAYRECLRINHGGHPEPGNFVVGTGASAWEGSLGTLLSLDWRRPSNIWSTLASLTIDGQLPDRLFPIAEDGGGNLLCFDYRSTLPEPPVIYWWHEVGGEDGITNVAESFIALLAMLGTV